MMNLKKQVQRRIIQKETGRRLPAGLLCRAILVWWCGLADSQPLLGATAMAAAEVPTHWGQGHSRNMVSEARGLPANFDPKSGRNIRWMADLGTSTYSTPIVARGRVFIGSNNGNPRDPRHTGDRGVLMCLDERTGRLLWQLVVPKLPHDPYLDCPGVGLTSSPTVEDDRVYLVSNRAEVLCLDLLGMTNGNDGPYQDESLHAAPLGTEPIPLGALDADIVWLTDLRSEVGAYPHDSANISVLVQGDYLYVSTPNGVDYTHRRRPSPTAPGLVVLDKRTGRLVARDNTGVGARMLHSTFSSAAFGIVNQKPLVFYGGGDGVVYGFDALSSSWPRTRPSLSPETLNLVWSFDCDPTAPKQNISQYQGNRREGPSSIVGMPVFHNDRIYVAVGGDPWHGKRQCWLQCIDATRTGDVTQSAMLWSYPLLRHCIATPSVTNGMVFIADMGRTVHCLEANTGKPYWTHEVDDEVWGSTLAADGKLYVGTHGGTFWVLAADRQKQVLGSVDLGSPMNTTPTAANGAIFVATMSRLYAVELASNREKER
jgi:outer membrane protein assembly factor BamB